ncbi:benzoate 4-monooxygenase cytochrome P450 [Xylaria sp. FL0064]|nr:benzoate 4-monooxygenase cytochrome P450 [Xylaria sp. FL0064]
MMLFLGFQSNTCILWLAILSLLVSILALLSIIYNIFFHPLAHIPGPFWARATGFPSCSTVPECVREPNTVLFRDAEAYRDIYSMKSNVRRNPFYTALKRNKHEATVFTSVDVAGHARKRKTINLYFTEKSLAAACDFIVKHVDRWHPIFEEEMDGDEWSAPVDFTEKVDALIFDIMGDLCFGRSFDVKESGDNPLKAVPHCIAEYMLFYYACCCSPFLGVLNWLKPHGLDRLFDIIAPPTIKQYNKFQAGKPLAERRQDIFYFLCEARDPETNQLAYNEHTLRAEANLLIIAGFDTTSISLLLADEILKAFESVDQIVYDPKLLACTYLKAYIDEGMRLTPTGPCELPREVLPGGLLIKGEYYPEGTIVGTVPWADSLNQEVYGDAEVFRPERWIVDDANSKEEVARLRSSFHLFSSGPGNCVGKNVAMAEMMITAARTLYRFHVRGAPGSTLGCGRPELGWGRTDENQFQLVGAYISLRQGPEVQFRKRII